MKRFLNITGIVSGMAGGAILLLFFVFLHISILISAITGIAGFVGTYLVLYSFKPKEEVLLGLGNELAPEELNRILKEGSEKVKLLQLYSTQVRDATVKQKILQITNMVEDIFGAFKKDPKEIKYARQFLSYYLDTTVKIIKKYTELSAQNVRTPEIQSTLLKAEGMLGSIEKAFEIQKTRLLRDDVMDLDVEIETLEKTFVAEDLK